MGSWPTPTLEDVARAQKGAFAMGPFGSDIKTENFMDEGVPIIRGGNLIGSRLREEGYAYLTAEKADELSNSCVFPGDIVFTHRGTLGQVAMIPRQSKYPKYVVSQSQMKVSLDESKAVPEFITYFFQSKLGQELLLSYASQTGVPAISRPLSSLRKMRVPLPPPPEQRAIAEVLGALDDKIESNQGLINTVDLLIRAEVLQATNNDSNSIAATFGEIAQRISEVADPRTLVEKVSYIGLEHMPRGSLILDAWGDSSGLDSGKSRFRKGDILFGRLRPYFKKVGVAPVDGICSTEILVLRPMGTCPLAVLAAFSASVEMINFASAAASGTKMPRVSWEYLQTWPVQMPGPETLTALDRELGPMLEAAISAVHQSQKLTAMRDALLPGLLSGRIRMPQAESLVEELV